VTLVHEGPIAIGQRGLHASRRLIDALSCAPQSAAWIHRVGVEGVEMEHRDKLVARRRTILASYPIDLRRVVRLACECAALGAWCAGLYLPELIEASEQADRGDWGAVSVSAGGAIKAAVSASALAAARDAKAAANSADRAGARASARAALWASAAAANKPPVVEARAVALMTEEIS